MQKVKTWRCEKYLEFIRSRPCTVTGIDYVNSVAHHVRCLGGGGMGLKPPDWMCVPLTAEQHTRLHAMGEKRFWDMHGLNPAEVVSLNLLIYLARNPLPELYDALGRIVEQ